MKNISTGFGLCVAAAAALAYPFVSSLAPSANASAVIAAAAVNTAATAQAAPTIVWYGTANNPNGFTRVFRAWSDGRIEAKSFNTNYECPGPVCAGVWVVVNDVNQGYNAAADVNFDEKVDGADLATLLNDWGNAPRQDIPPSDCPLALINP